MLAMSMVALAQDVTPLNIQIAEIKLDSLRALYSTEPTMYRASLDVLSQQLAKNGEELKAARNVYKEEQKHAGEMDKSIKEATKMAAALKKLYGKEEGELKSMQKTVEGQQRTLNKQRELNQETRDTYLAFLEKQQKELGYALREVAERQRGIADIETSIQNLQTKLQSYLQQVQQKSIELSQLEAQYKERSAILKAEQKSAKSMQ